MSLSTRSDCPRSEINIFYILQTVRNRTFRADLHCKLPQTVLFSDYDETRCYIALAVEVMAGSLYRQTYLIDIFIANNDLQMFESNSCGDFVSDLTNETASRTKRWLQPWTYFRLLSRMTFNSSLTAASYMPTDKFRWFSRRLTLASQTVQTS